mmetsp:Transcript_13534/g.31579  ORF Transcript_13534/g.31579 Transcript_13534/m.31579 type:complete len:256 (-) Transcript_13534:370-1137(-)
MRPPIEIFFFMPAAAEKPPGLRLQSCHLADINLAEICTRKTLIVLIPIALILIGLLLILSFRGRHFFLGLRVLRVLPGGPRGVLLEDLRYLRLGVERLAIFAIFCFFATFFGFFVILDQSSLYSATTEGLLFVIRNRACLQQLTSGCTGKNGGAVVFFGRVHFRLLRVEDDADAEQVQTKEEPAYGSLLRNLSGDQLRLEEENSDYAHQNLPLANIDGRVVLAVRVRVRLAVDVDKKQTHGERVNDLIIGILPIK